MGLMSEMEIARLKRPGMGFRGLSGNLKEETAAAEKSKKSHGDRGVSPFREKRSRPAAAQQGQHAETA
jgi:hypothetical protein